MTSKMLSKNYTDLYFVTWPLDGISTRLNRYAGFNKATGYSDNEHLVTIPYNYDSSKDTSLEKRIKIILRDPDKKVGFFTMNSRVLQEFLKATQKKCPILIHVTLE